MAYDTISVFEHLANDDTERRVASRRALAQAQNVVDQRLGAFFRGAQDEEEFFARLGWVEDEFLYHVARVSDEMGYEHPEYIAEALKDHYRLAAGVKFEETPEEEEEDDQEKQSKRQWIAKPVTSTPAGGTGPVPAAPPVRQPGVQHTQPGAGAPPVAPPGQPGEAQGGHVLQQAGAPTGPVPTQTVPTSGTGQAVTQGAGAGAGQALNGLLPNIPNPQFGGGIGDAALNMMGSEHTADLTKEAPGKEHMKGVSPKRNRQYEYIKDSLLDSGKDEERAKEEAARTVNKQRAEHGETKEGAFPPDPNQPQGPRDPFLQPDPNQESAIRLRRQSPAEVYDQVRQAPRHGEGVAFLDNQQRNVGQDVPGYAGQRGTAGGPVLYYDDGSMVSPSLTMHPDELPRDLGPQHQGARVNPAEQNDQSSHEVTCPECGGNGKTSNNSKCLKCGGRGKVPNFGDSMIDALSSTRLAESGNTDLGGPEPKIDKSRQTPTNPAKPKPEPESSRWPTKEKDIIEPIKAENRTEHPLKEIGEGSTEHQTLPTATDSYDGGFASGKEDFGPHTDTFDNDGQTTPVTRETQSSVVFPDDRIVSRAFAAL